MSRDFHRVCRTRRTAFTLIELLVVVSIIAILIAILIPSLSRARDTALLASQAANARQLAVAYTQFALDHQGYVLPAKVRGDSRFPPAVREAKARDFAGNPINTNTPAGERWLWRLSPYLGDSPRVVYRDAREYEAMVEQAASGDDYRMSLYTGFGLNEYYIGGTNDFYARPQYQSFPSGFFVRRLEEAHRPSDLFAFLSTASDIPADGGFRSGYFYTEPPRTFIPRWTGVDSAEAPTAPKPGDDPKQSGYVWPIAMGKVVANFLDGHAESVDWADMRDMRRWAPLADAPDWQLPPPGRN